MLKIKLLPSHLKKKKKNLLNHGTRQKKQAAQLT